MYDNLENFGKDCAVDGKYLDTYANQFHKSKTKKQMIIERNMMQRHLVKHITWKMVQQKKEWHFGFRAHIICDEKYGLPITYKLTPANNSE